MIIKKYIKMPLLRANVLVIFTDNMTEVVNKYSYTEDTVTYEAVTIDFSGNIVIVYNLTPSHNVIAHEVTHCVHNILSARDIHPVNGNEEIYAYTTGYITENIYKIISKSDHINIE